MDISGQSDNKSNPLLLGLHLASILASLYSGSRGNGGEMFGNMMEGQGNAQSMMAAPQGGPFAQGMMDPRYFRVRQPVGSVSDYMAIPTGGDRS